MHTPPLLPGPLESHALVAAIREGRRLLAEAGVADGARACAACQRPAGLDATFCAGCGARLRFPCPRCGATCRQGDGWCAGCGVELVRELVDDQLAALTREAEADRRRREDDPLRAYAETRVVADAPVRHVVGTRPDGAREFVKVARTAEGRRLLEAELEALDAIGPHPGVVALRARREHDGALVAVFEHLEPRMIRFPIAIPELLGVVAHVLETLEHVHGRGVVHADLKPKHIILTARGDAAERPVLIDWNLAQAPGPSRSGGYTPLFAPPEQVTGARVDARADLYALGVTLYLLFTHDRFPAVLEEAREPEPLLEVLQAKKAMNRAFLPSMTQYGGKLASLQQAPPQLLMNVIAQQASGPPAAAERDLEVRRVLGAKFLFTSELARTHDVNASIHLTGGLLEVVRRATALDPSDRYPDAAAMRAAVEELLARAGAPGARGTR
jgi:hypothetical protein